MYTLTFKKSVVSDLSTIPSHDVEKISAIFDSLPSTPLPHNAKKLVGTQLYRIRQGNYRIIYTVSHTGKTILIVAVQHRKHVYRNI